MCQYDEANVYVLLPIPVINKTALFELNWIDLIEIEAIIL